MNASEEEDYVNTEHGFGFDMEDDDWKRENEFHDTYIGDKGWLG
jgi:hypothetical protein